MASVQMVVIALEPACLGETLRVRPVFGGRVLLVVAQGKSRARLAGDQWGKP